MDLIRQLAVADEVLRAHRHQAVSQIQVQRTSWAPLHLLFYQFLPEM